MAEEIASTKRMPPPLPGGGPGGTGGPKGQNTGVTVEDNGYLGVIVFGADGA